MRRRATNIEHRKARLARGRGRSLAGRLLPLRAGLSDKQCRHDKPRDHAPPWTLPCVVHAEGAATIPAPAATSLATLLTPHLLHDGEIVVLLLKPSLWFIPLISLRFAAIVLLLLIAAKLFDDHLPPINHGLLLETGIFLIAARLMFGLLQWSSRLYVLTDLRIVAISGVLSANIFDCPLRKIARTRIIYSTRERITARGSIEIIPLADDQREGVWQTIARPRHVHEQIVAAINKARQGGCPPS